MTKRIGIEINGVLRDTIGKIKTVYEKFLMKNSEESEDIEIESFEYKINEPINS